jgi:hypothetical protein
VVYVIDGSSPKSMDVETGVKNSNYVTIMNGLKSGEKVTLRDPTLKDETSDGETEKKEIPL